MCKSAIQTKRDNQKDCTTMNAFLHTANIEAIVETPRRQEAEFYFNGICLLRVVLDRNWRKTPCLFRNLWRTVAE